MADAYPGLVKGVTNTSGTGTYTITTITGFPYRSLAQAVAAGSLTSGDTVQYIARDSQTLDADHAFEAGEGVFTVAAGPTYTVTRGTIHDSKNGPGVPMSWGLSGQRDFYLTAVPDSLTARTDRSNTFAADQSISHGANPTLNITESAGSPLALIDTSSTTAQIKKTCASGNSFLDFDAQPSGANSAFIRFFRSTTTAGTRALQVIKGDGTGTVTASVNAANGEPTFGDESAAINLQVKGSGGASVLLRDAAASADNKFLQILHNSTLSRIRSLTDALGSKYDFFVLDHANSRIGVNSTTPSAAFDIRADTVINDAGANNIGLRVEGDTDANLLVTDPVNSRVGIGTAAPTVKLEVNGSVRCSYIESAGDMLAQGNGNILEELTVGVDVLGVSLRLHGALAADPGSPRAGSIYFNTSTSKHRAYDGTSWHDLY
jgi:hypothetical protein